MGSLSFVLVLALVSIAASSIVPSDVKFFEDVSEWESRIVGGANAALGQFPYQASLHTLNDFHFCGASIINSNWVVSATHCTVSSVAAEVRVRVGTITRTFGGVSHVVSHIVNHPQYSAITLANDICTLRVEQPFTFNANVQPIPLAQVHQDAVASAVVSGWGQTSNPGAAADILQFINTQVLTLADCRARHSIINRLRVLDTTICAFSQADQGACMGDSGGPLTSNGQLVGAVSWGIPCAQGVPDVYARISSHIDFIAQNSQ